MFLSKYELCKMVITQGVVPKESVLFGMDMYLSKGLMSDDEYAELQGLLNPSMQ